MTDQIVDPDEVKEGEQINGGNQADPNTTPQGEGMQKPETDRA